MENPVVNKKERGEDPPSPISLRFGRSTEQTSSSEERISCTPLVTSHDCFEENVLIIGYTGAGKTTFLYTLGDVHYRSEAKISSQTTQADCTRRLFTVNGKHVFLTFIDTPGFGDSSGKSNLELENLILRFVKNEVTKLSMILVALPMGRRIDDGHTKDILECLNFLGPELREITAILATHAEGKSPESKKDWYKQISEAEHTSRMVQFCRGGLFFTGMNSSDDPIQAAQFERIQTKQISRIIQRAHFNTPVKLTGKKYQAEASKFMVFETAAKDSLTLLRLLPELRKICVEAIQMRQSLLELSGKVPDDQKERYGKSMNSLKEINQEEVDKQVIEWSKYQTAVEKYVGEGNRLSEASHSAMSIFLKLDTCLREARNLKFDVINLAESPSLEIEEEAFGA